ncbi:MAG: DM13 domain-containing protein, partial [Acidobacteriaceae bacterium]
RADPLAEMTALMSERLPYFHRIALRRLNNLADAEANFTAGTQDLATGTFHTVLHPTQGDASIYRNADGNRILRLTDFKTTNGPDVHIYMVAAERPSDNASVRSSAFIDLGEMKGNVGDQNYTLGPGVDLSKYRSVVIWCKRFSFNFGYAPLTLSQVSRN